MNYKNDKNENMKSLILSNIKAGFSAGLLNALIFHPPKTIIKYQYVNGTSIGVTFNNLLKNNSDKLRLFRGISPTMIKYSVGKMGETSFYTYFNSIDKEYNKIEKLVLTSSFVTLWRVNLMPFDTLSNTLQVHGRKGYSIITKRIDSYGIGTLYSGTSIYGVINFINCFTWFGIFNTMNGIISNDVNKDLKNGIVGFTSTLGSDILNNPLRIIKTYKQSHNSSISYKDSFNEILRDSGGYKNYFIRGLGIKTLLNCLTSSLYVIMWKRLEEYY
tara:strand:- start:99 stop:917 length:819 start_codon:yes stop_codon:yes gene_type:complete